MWGLCNFYLLFALGNGSFVGIRFLMQQKYICGFLQPSEKKVKDLSHHLKFSQSCENSLNVCMFTKSFAFASYPMKQLPHPAGRSTWTSSQCQGMTLYPPLPCRLQMQIKYLQEWMFTLKRQIQHELCPIEQTCAIQEISWDNQILQGRHGYWKTSQLHLLPTASFLCTMGTPLSLSDTLCLFISPFCHSAQP